MSIYTEEAERKFKKSWCGIQGCPCGGKPADSHEVERKMAQKREARKAALTGNQAALGNGCVCDSGCESCDRLAAEVIALRKALAARVKGE